MPTVYLSPVFGAGAQLFTSQGVVLAGGKINTYLANSTTPQATYTDNTGTTSNGVQIILDSAGRPPQEIWIPAGVPIKIIVTTSADVQVGIAYDNISGVNDPGGAAPANTEWISSATPSYINASQFSVPGDLRSLFPVGQRVRYTVTAGTGYGTVTASAFSAVTTVTIQADTTPLDSGLSVMAYGLLNALHPSVSAVGVAYSTSAADSTGPSVNNTLKKADRAITLTTTTGSATVLVLTPTPAMAAYALNAPVLIKLHVTLGAAPTLNISGLGALNLKQIDLTGAKVAASLPAGAICEVVYDGVDLVSLVPTQAAAADKYFYMAMVNGSNAAPAANVVLSTGTWYADVQSEYAASDGGGNSNMGVYRVGVISGLSTFTAAGLYSRAGGSGYGRNGNFSFSNVQAFVVATQGTYTMSLGTGTTADLGGGLASMAWQGARMMLYKPPY